MSLGKIGSFSLLRNFVVPDTIGSLGAGQTIDIFIVSRSRHHGLRPDQSRVAFYFHKDGMDVVEGHELKLRSTDFSLSAPVRAVLGRLVSRDID